VVRNEMKLQLPVRTLAEILKARGYRTVARIANPVLNERYGFDQGFQDFAMPDGLEVVQPNMFEGSPVVRDAARILEEKSDQPLFLWLHFMDPHGPYAPAASCAAPFRPDDYRWPDDAELPVGDSNYGLLVIPKYQVIGDLRAPAEYRARYDGEVRCTDDHLRAIIRLLQQRQRWDRALLVFTADHGESLGEHRCYFQHGGYAYEDSLRVPLVVRAPGLVPAGRRVAQTVSMIDLAPTILDLLGTEPQERMEGRSLRPLLDGPGEDRPAFAQTYYGDGLVTFRRGTLKYIFTPPPNVAPGGEPSHIPAREELYDLGADAGELHDLAGSAPERLRQARERVQEWLQEQGGGASTVGGERAPVRNPAVERQLRALGYLE
jgi:arylsulfatase A-like enzyme